MPKWLQEKLKQQGKQSIEPRVYQPKQRTILETMKKHKHPPKPPKLVTKPSTKELVEKKYDYRNIFVLLDGQDILTENLEFSYVEINERLSKFVPDKVWKSQAAQRLTLN